MLYRKKPVVIEAMQITEDNEYIVMAWANNTVYRDKESNEARWKIPTLEGVMTAIAKDFIIRGVKGEYYPCKPEIFYETYEEVTDGNAGESD
jgi:hypothetical protein